MAEMFSGDGLFLNTVRITVAREFLQRKKELDYALFTPLLTYHSIYVLNVCTLLL
jgi:hypothetical protein